MQRVLDDALAGRSAEERMVASAYRLTAAAAGWIIQHVNQVRHPQVAFLEP